MRPLRTEGWYTDNRRHHAPRDGFHHAERDAYVDEQSEFASSKTMTKIAIIGGSGYTAAELIKILLRHPSADIVAVTTRQEGTPTVAELHPSLVNRIDLRCE